MIAGLQKMTLLDFPGRVACTVFLQGCNFRCPFCHNTDLLPPEGQAFMTEDALIAFLQKRTGLLDGVCITGGEPLVKRNIVSICRRAAAVEGIAEVCLTTNGILQVLLSVILGVFAIVSAWQIHEIAYRTHLRGKTRVYIGLVCVLIWIVLGFLCGQWAIPLGAALGQWALGYLAAYGGRRSDLGRHDAGQILGLRSYLKHLKGGDINRLMLNDPDYFFNMAEFT